MTNDRRDAETQMVSAEARTTARSVGRNNRSRLLSAVLAVMLAWGIAWPVFIRVSLLPAAGWTHPAILVSGAFSLGVLCAVLLNRRGRYLAAASLTAGLLLAGVFASLHFTLSGAMEPVFSRNDSGLLAYLVLPVVLGAVLLPPSLLSAVLGCALGGVLAVPLLYPHMSWSAVLYGPVLFLLVVCGLLLFVSFLLSDEQRRNLVGLKQSEERYRSLFEQSPDANLLIGPDGLIRAVNRVGLQLFDYGQGEMEGAHVRMLFANAADRDAFTARVEQQGGLYDDPIRLRTRNGSVLDCLVTIWVRRDAAGRTLEYQTIVRDVTARVQSEEELKLKGQLLDVAHDAIMLVDPGGVIVFANQAASGLTGYPADELLRMNIRQLNTREGAEQVPLHISAIMQEGALGFSTTFVRKDGNPVQVEVRSKTLESRGRTLLLSVCRDVTTRKAAESELRLRGQLLDLANDAVFLHDLKGRFLYVNEAAVLQSGYARSELLRMTLRDLDDREAAERSSDRMAQLMNRRSLTFEGGHRRKDGSIVPVEVRARLVESGDQSVVLSVARDISERKKAEATLKAERDRAQRYLDVAGVMVIALDARGDTVLINRRGAEILGRKVENLIGRSWLDTAVPEDQRDRVRDVLRTIMSGDAEPYEYVENDIVTAAERRRTIAWHNVLLRDADGKPSGVLSSGEDITERLATERALRESEERYRSLFEQSIDAIFENAPDGSHIEVNGAWLKLFGFTPDDLVVMNAGDLYVDAADREEFVRVMRETGEVRDEVRLRKKDGTEILCQRVAAVRRDTSGSVVAFQGIVRDVTALKRAEQQLRESEEKYRSLFEQSLDAIYINTPDGMSLEANRAWLDMFGYSNEELSGLNSVDIYADSRDRTEFLRLMREDGFVAGEARFRRKDGTPFDGQRSVVPLRDENGNIVRFVGIMRDITARKKSEQQLRESEEKYRMLFEQSMDAVAIVSVDGTLVNANPAYLRLFGHTPDAIGREVSARHYVDPADREEMLRRVDRDGVIIDQEVKLKKVDGTVMDVVRSVVARRDQQGRLVGLQSVTRDITAEKRQRAALADELARRRILVEQSRDGIVVLDQDGRVVETNRRFADMLGYLPEEVLRLRVWDWDVPTPSDGLREMIRTVDEAGDHFETQHRRKDGTVYDVEISTNAAVFGGQKLIFCVCRDITKRKKAEEALRESELRFRALVEHTGLGFTVTRTDGSFIEANDVFLQMTGYSRDDLLRLRMPDVYASEETSERMLKQCLWNGYVRGEELEFTRKDGSPLFLSLTCAFVPRGGERVVISEFLDITERRRVEAEVRRSREELRLLATRLEEAREEERTGIARELHDQLGQALTALKFDLDTLLRAAGRQEGVSVEKVTGMLRLVDDTARDVRRLSSELRPGILDDVGLAAAMDWQLTQFAERTGIQCRMTGHADDARLDRSRSTALFRVFQELLTNIARHAGARGVSVGLDEEGGNYVLTVSDDGAGITPQQIADTSSLGLIGMRERLRPLGGSIQLKGIPGKGTTVRVTLPLQRGD